MQGQFPHLITFSLLLRYSRIKERNARPAPHFPYQGETYTRAMENRPKAYPLCHSCSHSGYGGQKGFWRCHEANLGILWDDGIRERREERRGNPEIGFNQKWLFPLLTMQQQIMPLHPYFSSPFSSLVSAMNSIRRKRRSYSKSAGGMKNI